MKKYLTSAEYKKWNTKRAEERLERKIASKEKRKIIRGTISNYSNKASKQLLKIIREGIKQPIIAPNDFRLIENTPECLSFFRNMRSDEYVSSNKLTKFVKISLVKVTKIDYGTVSILTAIHDSLRIKGILLQGDLPKNEECKKFFIDSGFLNDMVDDKNRSFPKAQKSDLIFFEKGIDFLSNDNSEKISNLIKNAVRHLTGVSRHFLPIKSILLELCGNSIEWSGSENKQWLLGIQYEQEKVIFTVTDVGKGILATLYKSHGKKFRDFISLKSDDEVLKGAFDKKYGSVSQEVNRNKGLPSLKVNYEDGNITNLKVLTNNVILDFDNKNNSKAFPKGTARFKGTFYQWETNIWCINNFKN